MASAIHAVLLALGKGERFDFPMGELRQQPRAGQINDQHHGPRINCVRGDHWRAVGFHQLLAQQNPNKRASQRSNHEQVAGERRRFAPGSGAVSASTPQRGSDSRASPAPAIPTSRAFTGKSHCRRGQQHWHRAHHERCVTTVVRARPLNWSRN